MVDLILFVALGVAVCGGFYLGKTFGSVANIVSKAKSKLTDLLK